MNYKEFEEWKDVIFKINVDLNIALNNAKYLLDGVHDEEEQELIKHGFFQHHIYQLKFISVIQLAKILDNRKNQKFNIIELIRRLENESIDAEFKDIVLSKGTIGNSDVDTFVKEVAKDMKLLIAEYKIEIQNLTQVRDQFYAHRDKNIAGLVLSWDDIEKLVILINSLYNLLHGKFHDTHMLFEKTSDWQVKDIIKTFVKFKRISKKK